MSVDTLLTLLLGGGLASTLVALFTGIKSLREGYRTREKDTIGSLVSRAEDAETGERDSKAEAARAIRQRDYWRNRSADLEYILRQTYGYEHPAASPPEEGASPS